MPGNLLKNLEKSWKSHGILSVQKSGNPDLILSDFANFVISVHSHTVWKSTDRQEWNENLRQQHNVTCKVQLHLGGNATFTLLGGVCGCQGACMVAGGACVVAGGGGVRRIWRDTVNERAVRILLECILVLCFSWHFKNKKKTSVNNLPKQIETALKR